MRRFLPLIIAAILFVIFGGETFTVTRTLANGDVVRQTFTVGQSVLVLVGGGALLKAVITGMGRRGRVKVKFQGGDQGAVKKTAIFREPEGMAGETKQKNE